MIRTFRYPLKPNETQRHALGCGAAAKKTLDQRQHECSCGFSAHRDHNAALVILGRGLRPAQLAEAFDGIAVHQRDAAVCP